MWFLLLVYHMQRQICMCAHTTLTVCSYLCEHLKQHDWPCCRQINCYSTPISTQKSCRFESAAEADTHCIALPGIAQARKEFLPKHKQ